MGVSVVYSFSLPYSFEPRSGSRFPGLQVTIHGSQASDSTIAHIDTGAEYCYFDGVRCNALGLNLLAGKRTSFTTAAGAKGEFYLHQIDLEFLGQRVRTLVGFSKDRMVREILGRSGFLEHIQFGVRERHELVFIEPCP